MGWVGCILVLLISKASWYAFENHSQQHLLIPLEQLLQGTYSSLLSFSGKILLTLRYWLSQSKICLIKPTHRYKYLSAPAPPFLCTPWPSVVSPRPPLFYSLYWRSLSRNFSWHQPHFCKRRTEGSSPHSTARYRSLSLPSWRLPCRHTSQPARPALPSEPAHPSRSFLKSNRVQALQVA